MSDFIKTQMEARNNLIAQAREVLDIADDLAKAVWELDNTNSFNPAKEARVVDSKETR